MGSSLECGSRGGKRTTNFISLFSCDFRPWAHLVVLHPEPSFGSVGPCVMFGLHSDRIVSWSCLLPHHQAPVALRNPFVMQFLGKQGEHGSRNLVSPFLFQIFIKSPIGRSFLIRINLVDSVQHLKLNIMQKDGYLVHTQNLIFESRVLQDNRGCKITTFNQHPP